MSDQQQTTLRGGRGFRAAFVFLLLALFWLAAAGLAAAQEPDPLDPRQPVPAGTEDRQCGIVAYDWSGPVETTDRGFPREQPPQNNFDWTSPVNYAEGTLYYRAIIYNQPEPQEMRLQLCFWQPLTPGADYKFGLENCGPQQNITGERGNWAVWQVDEADMWKLNGNDIDWTRPRYRTAVAVKNSSGQPVSNYNGWDWNGEVARDWYPRDMRFSAVVVPLGGEFCGWDHYFEPSAVNLAAVSADTVAPPAVGLLLLLLGGGLLSVWALRRREAA